MRHAHGLIRRVVGRRPILAGLVAALLGVPLAIQTATAGADAIDFNESSTALPSEPVQTPPAHAGTIAGCPNSHPHLTGGGASLAKVDSEIQLWSTSLLEEGIWNGTASNTSGSSTRLTVTALCAKRGSFLYPDAQKVGERDDQVLKGVNCPAGRKLTGGGVDGRPIDLSAKRRGGVPPPEIAATRPEDGPDANSKPDDRWVGVVGRGDLTVNAVCAKKAGTLKYVHSAREPLPRSGPGFGFARARCPQGAEVTGGGADTTGIDLGLEIVDSSPDPSGANQGWVAAATNITSHEESIQAYAICRV
jgi:hypothetical protein